MSYTGITSNREAVIRERRKIEWMMIGEAVGLAIITPLAIAAFARFTWQDAVAGNTPWLIGDAFVFGTLVISTWRATRYGQLIRRMSANFDAQLDKFTDSLRSVYEQGCSDERAKAVAFLRQFAQSVADQTGHSLHIQLGDEQISCEPKGRQDRPHRPHINGNGKTCEST